jgi:membrane fusion protein, multidrug efflux system
MPSRAPVRTPDTTDIYTDEAHAGDALVARTIRANSGGGQQADVRGKRQ